MGGGEPSARHASTTPVPEANTTLAGGVTVRRGPPPPPPRTPEGEEEGDVSGEVSGSLFVVYLFFLSILFYSSFPLHNIILDSNPFNLYLSFFLSSLFLTGFPFSSRNSNLSSLLSFSYLSSGLSFPFIHSFSPLFLTF